MCEGNRLTLIRIIKERESEAQFIQKPGKGAAGRLSDDDCDK